MKPLFLDTSAVLKVLFNEPGAEDVAARMQAAPRLLASRLVRIEAERAIHRLVQRRPEAERARPLLEHALRELWPQVDMWDLSEDICALAGRIAPGSHLPSLDAIHLATWQRAREHHADLELLTFDARLLALA
ncbi:MAG: type II toxin-antitoxin system VapC family toxin [Deltaproteobacteria bacterium]|nr:type II toxin-antitoxin system VapC family toxin [Deltaproteobacteria bacterium]